MAFFDSLANPNSKSDFLQNLFAKLTRIFVALDKHFAHKKREGFLAFFLPILLCAFVALAWILPAFDSVSEEAIFALNHQKNLSQELAKKAMQNPALDISKSKKMLESLQEKSLNNEALGYLLKPFNAKFDNIQNPQNTKENPQILPQNPNLQKNLVFSAVGDSEALEDVLEILETNPFIFIQNLTINAPFASGLEMRFEGVNFGEIFGRISLNE